MVVVFFGWGGGVDHRVWLFCNHVVEYAFSVPTFGCMSEILFKVYKKKACFTVPCPTISMFDIVFACLILLKLFQVASCTHVFCKSCLIDFSASMGQVTCPSCSKPLTADFSSYKDQGDQNIKTTVKGFRSTSILNRIRLDDFQTSTKIDALVCCLQLFLTRFHTALLLLLVTNQLLS